MSTTPPRWFASLGEPMNPIVKRHAEAMCAQLPTFTTTVLAEPVTAVQAERNAAWIDEEGAWWELQETERETLWHVAVERHGEDGVVGRLAVVGGAAATTIPLPTASGLSGNAQRAAREAALLAVHHAALAELAGAGEHWFVHKERLFALGRWVVGLRHGRLVVY